MQKIYTISAVILLSFLGCKQKSSQTDNKHNEPIQQSDNRQNTNSECPQTVVVSPRDGGEITLSWQQYAPDMNTFVTVTVVPYSDKEEVKTYQSSTNQGTFTLPKHYMAGFYSVYYTLQFGSATHHACTGVQQAIEFYPAKV